MDREDGHPDATVFTIRNLWPIAFCLLNVVVLLPIAAFHSEPVGFAIFVAFLALFLVNGIIGGKRRSLGWTVGCACLGFAGHLITVATGVAIEHGGFTVGLAPCSVIYIAPLTAIGYFFGRYVRRMPEPGMCPGCGYDLRGNVSGVCSECGYQLPR